MGKSIDRRLRELGATPFHAPAFADEATTMAETIEPWVTSVYLALETLIAGVGSTAAPTVSAAPPSGDNRERQPDAKICPPVANGRTKSANENQSAAAAREEEGKHEERHLPPAPSIPPNKERGVTNTVEEIVGQASSVKTNLPSQQQKQQQEDGDNCAKESATAEPRLDVAVAAADAGAAEVEQATAGIADLTMSDHNNDHPPISAASTRKPHDTAAAAAAASNDPVGVFDGGVGCGTDGSGAENGGGGCGNSAADDTAEKSTVKEPAECIAMAAGVLSVDSDPERKGEREQEQEQELEREREGEQWSPSGASGARSISAFLEPRHLAPGFVPPRDDLPRLRPSASDIRFFRLEAVQEEGEHGSGGGGGGGGSGGGDDPWLRRARHRSSSVESGHTCDWPFHARVLGARYITEGGRAADRRLFCSAREKPLFRRTA